MAFSFESLTPGQPSLLNGNMSVSVIDPDTGTPNTIIEIDEDWKIQVNWEITGFVAPALGGDWKVTAYLAAVDGGTSPGSVGSQSVSLNAAPPSLDRKYQATINVAKNSIRVGIFQLNVALAYSNLNVPLEMAAFVDGGTLQFFDPGPFPDALGNP